MRNKMKKHLVFSKTNASSSGETTKSAKIVKILKDTFKHCRFKTDLQKKAVVSVCKGAVYINIKFTKYKTLYISFEIWYFLERVSFAIFFGQFLLSNQKIRVS